MDDMQQLMDLVMRLRRQGVDVGRLLSGGLEVQQPSPAMNLPAVTPSAPAGDGAIQNLPTMMPAAPAGNSAMQNLPFMEPSEPFYRNDASTMPTPEYKPFTGPGPGAVVDFDYDALVERRRREQLMKENPMRGLLEIMGQR